MRISQLVGKKIPERLQPKEWVKAAQIGIQEQMITFLLRAFGLLLFATMMVFFLQGFHFCGFTLDHDILMWLGAATIGEIGGLLTIAFRSSFR